MSFYVGSGHSGRDVPPCHPGDPLFEAWLGSCDGFRVYLGFSMIGTVARVDSDLDGPPTRLVIRTGLFHRTQFTLDVSAIASITPEARRIDLAWMPE